VIRGPLACVFCVLIIVVGSREKPALAQLDPYVGIPPDIAAVAEAIRSGSVDRILEQLPPEPHTVIQTAYPGGGGDVALATARQRIRERVLGDVALSDAYGTGAYTLIAIWVPAVTVPPRPADVTFIGSGIGSDGVRVSTAFTIARFAGRAAIASYGAIVDLRDTLTQLAGQGELRFVPNTEPPGAPLSGSGWRRQDDDTPAGAGLPLVAVVLLMGGVMAIGRTRRSR
jgi:hypothetical protein